MGLKEIMDFAKSNPVAYIATVDGSQPRVRAFDMWKADETGFYFHNNATVGVYNQMTGNSKVELFFPSPGGKEALRVLGNATLLSDPKYAAEYYGISAKSSFQPRITKGMMGKDVIFRVTGTAWLRPAKGKRGKDQSIMVDEVKIGA